MTSSPQISHAVEGVNIVVPAPRAQELFNSLFVPGGESTCLPRRGNHASKPKPGDTSSSPITINSNSSASSSPSLLPPHLQLSADTLCQSDFPTASSTTSSAPKDDLSNINTPSPKDHLIPGSWTVGRETSREALEEYQKGYKPQVKETSKVLQKILGLRNGEAFQPPNPTLPGQRAVTIGSAVEFNPALRHLRVPNAGLGIQRGRLGSGPGPGPVQGRTTWEAAEEFQRGGGHGIFHQGQQSKVTEQPLTLRESLLMHGRQPYGDQARTELRSLTFHDLTPDMRTGGFKNEMLAHFEADPAGRTRLVSYEVNVPLSERHQPIYTSSGNPVQQTERWISFLISVPLISFKAGTTNPALPPNLPCQHGGHPPTSWLIFAAPAHAVTSHPPSRDSIIVRRTPGGAEALRPVARYDYDFSLNGVPAFEFMNKRPVLGAPLTACLERGVDGAFLSGKGVAPYEGGGVDFVRLPARKGNHDDEEEAEEKHDERGGDDAEHAQDDEEDEEEDEEDVAREDMRRWEDVENVEAEMANSWWWRDARSAFIEDRKMWARVKESMARGCCRVVLRVEEAAQHGGRAGRPGVRGRAGPLVGMVGAESEYD